MKNRMIAVILALSAVTWAQTASQNTTPQASTAASPKSECCCGKAAAEDAAPCSAQHHNMSAKDSKAAMPCCGKDSTQCCNGKDGASCKRADKNKTATTSSDCMKDHEKDCCGSKSETKTSAGCCKEHCAAHASTGAGN